MSDNKVFQDWFLEHGIEDVEAFVPDVAGPARGKVVPAPKFNTGPMKMPESVFPQAVSGAHVAGPDNVEDRDMRLVPDPGSLRPVPWAVDALQASGSMRDMLGDAFVGLYTKLKDAEYKKFQEIITPWEREILMFNV